MWDGKGKEGGISSNIRNKNLLKLNQESPFYHQEYGVTLIYYKFESQSAILKDENKTFINLSQNKKSCLSLRFTQFVLILTFCGFKIW